MTDVTPNVTPEELFSRIGSKERLEAIAAYDLANLELRAELNALATRTAAAVDSPVGLVSAILDTMQLLTGRCGLPEEHWAAQVNATPAEWSVCAYALSSEMPYLRGDLAADPVHARSPLVYAEGLLAYAGMAVVDPNGTVLGMVCVLDVRTRDWTIDDVEVLRGAATEAAAILRRYPAA